MPDRIRKRETLADALRRIAATGCAQAAELLRTPDEDAIHQARVRIKRVRAILALCRGPLGDIARSESAALRHIARTLAPPRDAVSLRDAFESLAERFGALDPETFENIRGELERRAVAAKACAITAEAINTARHLLLSASLRAGSWPIDADGFDAIRDGLTRSYAKCRRQRREALASPDPGVRHAWRSRVKRLAEQMRLIDRVWKHALAPHTDALREIASRLGDDHDLSLLAALLRSEAACFGDSASVKAVARLAERSAAEQVRACRRPARRALAEKPAAFVARVEALWKVWTR